MELTTRVLETPAALEPWLGAWDALAVAAHKPYCAPGWMLPWWEELRPMGAELRVVLVLDGAALVAVAPFFVQPGRAGRRDARMLACDVAHGLDLLCVDGGQAASAPLIARALAAGRPTLVAFEGFDTSYGWPDRLRAVWPGPLRPAELTSPSQPTPVVRLAAEDFDAWLAGRSRNFRQQIAQSRRRMEAAGGRLVLATAPAEVEAGIIAFERLHAGRWSARGGSNLSGPATAAMLRSAAARLPDGRLRLWTLELGDAVVAVQVLVAAGGEVAYWNGGWDESQAKLRPALLVLVAAVEDAFRRGEARVDLGGGAHPYKLRLADTPVTDAIGTRTMLPLGSRFPIARAALVPRQARRVLLRGIRRLPPERQAQVRDLARRVGAAR